MLRRVALVRTDVTKEITASIIRVTRIGKLREKLAVTNCISSERASVASYE
jgi:DNA-binding TFAR19-related protein (PDSD5 family)